MKSILITGCNRGLGLGILKHLLKRKEVPKCIIATCRDERKTDELRQLATNHNNLHILQIDLRNTEKYDEFSQQVGDIVKEDGLNVLFNNAGMSSKFTRIQFVKTEQMMDTFMTNCIAPLMLTKALLAHLKKAAANNLDKPAGIEKAAVINMSSLLGSIELNSDGGLYPYKCSKAALNMVTKSMSIDLKKDDILVTSLHPGWVQTDMGGSNAPMDIDSSCSSIIELLYKLNSCHNGGFYQWDGKKLAW